MTPTVSQFRRAILLALVPALIAAAADPKPAPAAPSAAKIDPQAKTVLDRMGAYYKSLTGFTVDNTISVAQSKGTTQQSMKLDYRIAMTRPDKLAITLGENKVAAEIVRNGKDVTFYAPPLNKYAVEKAPDTLFDTATMAILSGPTTFLSIIASLMSDDPVAKMLENVTDAKYVGVEDVNGVKNAHIKLVQDEIDYDIWIDAGEKPLVTKVVPDFAKAMAKDPKEQQQPDVKLTINVLFDKWAPNATVPAETFAFTPPQGTTKEESVAKLLGREEEAPSPLLGKTAPDFTLDLLDGGKLTLSSLKGKSIVVLDFWATWCGPCRKGLPIVTKVTSDLKDKGVVFYAVNQSEDKETVGAFVKNEGLAMNVVLDTNSAVGDSYGVHGIPQTVIIGKDGTVQAVHVGLMPNFDPFLRKQLNTLISGGTLLETPAKS